MIPDRELWPNGWVMKPLAALLLAGLGVHFAQEDAIWSVLICFYASFLMLREPRPSNPDRDLHRKWRDESKIRKWF